MKKSRILLTCTSLLLCFSLTACSVKSQAVNLMEGITPNEVTALSDLSSYNGDIADFAVRLFKASADGNENILISPLSVLYAVSMTANGANGDTRREIEETIGMTIDELNNYLYSYMKGLSQDEKAKLSLADSIWFTDHERFTVNPDFLQKNADFYGADIYKVPFNDETCKDINDWVKENTDGMIENILDEIPGSAIMYLVNALAFDGEWVLPYEQSQITTETFTKEDGTKQTAEFMSCAEYAYLEDENTTGFIKYYSGGKYAFAALLPNESVSMSEYLSTLDGKKLNTLLSSSEETKVLTKIPKFESSYSEEMMDTLFAMGIKKAFDPEKADFQGLGSSDAGNIFVSRVLHKTYISIDERGTKAGASTVVEMSDECCVELLPVEYKEVYLDRPFVYMLIDRENNIPFFIGTTMSIE